MCPRCRHEGFRHTGAFWQCSSCFFSITQQALKEDQKTVSEPLPSSERPRTGFLLKVG